MFCSVSKEKAITRITTHLNFVTMYSLHSFSSWQPLENEFAEKDQLKRKKQ